MCDICQLKCDSCGRSIETHIGDYSVDRENVTAFCHRCHDAALKYLCRFNTQTIVFTDSGCMFMVELPRTIHLNGSRSECLGRVPVKRKPKK